MELINVIDRKHEMRMLPAPSQYVRQRIAQAAEQLSRAGDMALHVEIANEALCHYVALLYQCDSDGVWANIDSRTHRLLVPAPWGSLGWKRWGVRKWEAETLRAVLMGRIGRPRHTPLFDYNGESRNWFLNAANYGSLDKANAYLKYCGVSLDEWRAEFKLIDRRVDRRVDR